MISHWQQNYNRDYAHSGKGQGMPCYLWFESIHISIQFTAFLVQESKILADLENNRNIFVFEEIIRTE